jgi:putative two-component system response regulator
VGNAIPLAGRIMAIADVYDALISKRVYKDAVPHAQAMKIMIEGNGTHFDPILIEAFLELEPVFSQIAARNMD